MLLLLVLEVWMLSNAAVGSSQLAPATDPYTVPYCHMIILNTPLMRSLTRLHGGCGGVFLSCLQMENMLEALAAFLVTVASWFTTLLHFMGLVNPNKQLEAGAGASAAAGAGSSAPRKTGLEQVEAAAERISDRMEHLLKVWRLGGVWLLG